MKYLVLASAWLWSFAALPITPSADRQSIDGDSHVVYYSGKGSLAYADALEEHISYRVTLKTKNLNDSRTLWEYSFTDSVDKQYNGYQRLILEGNDVFKVLVPAGEDSQDDFGSYKITGWGYKIEHRSGEQKQREQVTLHYTHEGNRVIGSVSVEKGGDSFTSIWSVGNADGMIRMWGHEMTKVVERFPE